MFIVNGLFLYFLMNILCKLPEDGDNTDTCSS